MGMFSEFLVALFTFAWWGWLFGTIVAAGHYFKLRVEHTLEVEWYGYGVFVLLVEMLAAVGGVLSAVAMTLSCGGSEVGRIRARTNGGAVRALRVLIYATGASLDDVKATVYALLQAHVPESCHKIIYVFDDLGDPELRHWVSRNRDNDGGVVEYVTRQVNKLEFNVRSRSFNSLLSSIYGLKFKACAPVVDVGPRDIIFVLDVGQVCYKDFFEQNLATLQEGYSLVLSPQGETSHSPLANLVNCKLRSTGLGSVARETPTISVRANFAVRIDTLKAVDFFDKTVLSEEYALMAELAKRREAMTYLDIPLAKSRKDKKIRRVFFERSTWALSSLLVLLGRRNPFSKSLLSMGQKITYMAAAVSQLISMLVVPIYILVPVAAVWLGVMPAVVKYEAVIGFIIFYTTLAVLQYLSQYPVQILMANITDHIFWFAYFRGLVQGLHHSMKSRNDAKKIVKSVMDSVGKDCMEDILESKKSYSHHQPDKYLIPIGEKGEEDQAGPSTSGEITESGSVSDAHNEQIDAPSANSIASPVGTSQTVLPKTALGAPKVYMEIVIAAVTLLISVATVVAGVGQVSKYPEPNIKSVIILSTAWAVFNAVPPVIILYYSILRTKGMKFIAFIATIVSLLAFVGAMAVMFFRHVHTHDYEDAIHKSFAFYDAQKSGELPSFNRIPWRGDSGLLDITVNEKSLAGGFYDSAGTKKHGLPLAVATSLLAWGIVEFPSGYGHELKHAEAIIRHASDYLLRAHTRRDQLYVLVADREPWGRPEDTLSGRQRVGKFIDPQTPGSDVAGSAAAALAATSVVFRDSDPPYSKVLLAHAKQLYSLANRFPGKYSDGIKVDEYISHSFRDDLGWGAAWLYYATNEYKYIVDARKHMGNHAFSPFLDYDNVGPAVCVLMASITKEDKYKVCSENVLDSWKDRMPRTPARLSWSGEKDPLPRAANAAFLAMVYAKNLKGEAVSSRKLGGYTCWAHVQIDYMLGDSGRSFMVGFGKDYPKQPRHQGASCPDFPAVCSASSELSGEPNPQILNGALVSGPDKNDEYEDSRLNLLQSRVSLMNNAGFTSALAALSSVKDFAKCYHGFGAVDWLRVVDA